MKTVQKEIERHISERIDEDAVVPHRVSPEDERKFAEEMAEAEKHDLFPRGGCPWCGGELELKSTAYGYMQRCTKCTFEEEA